MKCFVSGRKKQRVMGTKEHKHNLSLELEGPPLVILKFTHVEARNGGNWP